MPFNWLEKSKQSVPYEKIAVIYDFLMRHVDYEGWHKFVLHHLQARAPQAQSLLEMACGTGMLLRKFSTNGYRLHGFDRSPAMLHVAQRRLAEASTSVTLWAGDMRQFSLQQPVDAVICLYDSVNYCLTEDELAATFASVWHCLSAGGIFIFDVCTLRNCRYNFSNYYEKDFYRNISYIRQSHFEPERQVQINEFWLTVNDETETTYFECHTQKIYPLLQIQDVLQHSARWTLLGMYDNFSQRPGTEKSDRVHFVVRKI